MRSLMLVSADAGPAVRAEVDAGLRPLPEFLQLERVHGVELLDWSRLGNRAMPRSKLLRSLRAAQIASRLPADAYLSDGEHVGIPLGAMLNTGGRRTHVMIGHRLTTAAKRALYRTLRVDRRISRIVVHSRRQAELAPPWLGIDPGKVFLTPYGVDVSFWRPQAVDEAPLIFAPGRSHRDFDTLAEATAGLDEQVIITAASQHSPREPYRAATGVGLTVRELDYQQLRTHYARARLVVIPLLAVDFPAGITTLLEAMAMGKAVIVAGSGLDDWMVDRQTAVRVPARDPAALRTAIRRLLAESAERRRLGANAREAVCAHWSTPAFAARLAGHLEASGVRAAASVRA
jgi:glycosyltransferase involved in cell wall biosynthesis